MSKNLTITTLSGDITRTAAAFEAVVSPNQGDLTVTGYDEQGEKSCVVMAARGEWVDVQIDDADEPDETATDADVDDTQRTVFVDVTSFIPEDLRERIEAASKKCTCPICTIADRIKAAGGRDD